MHGQKKRQEPDCSTLTEGRTGMTMLRVFIRNFDNAPKIDDLFQKFARRNIRNSNKTPGCTVVRIHIVLISQT